MTPEHVAPFIRALTSAADREWRPREGREGHEWIRFLHEDTGNLRALLATAGDRSGQWFWAHDDWGQSRAASYWTDQWFATAEEAMAAADLYDPAP